MLISDRSNVADFKSPWTMEPFRHRGIGELWMVSLAAPAFRFLMRLQPEGLPACTPYRASISRRKTRHPPLLAK